MSVPFEAIEKALQESGIRLAYEDPNLPRSGTAEVRPFGNNQYVISIRWDKASHAPSTLLFSENGPPTGQLGGYGANDYNYDIQELYTWLGENSIRVPADFRADYPPEWIPDRRSGDPSRARTREQLQRELDERLRHEQEERERLERERLEREERERLERD